jgi:FHS family L-fucose permease-like MFS transporter
MAIVGGAALTPLMGKVADSASVAQAYLVPAACFALITLYAWLGSSAGSGELAEAAAAE